MALKEKAPKLIEEIFANPGLMQQIISIVVESVKKRGGTSSYDNSLLNYFVQLRKFAVLFDWKFVGRILLGFCVDRKPRNGTQIQ